MREHREMVGDRDVVIFPGYYEWLIQVSNSVIAVINDPSDNPPSGDVVVDAIRDREPTVVISDDNVFWCDTDEELKRAEDVLESLSEQEYNKISEQWDREMLRYYGCCGY